MNEIESLRQANQELREKLCALSQATVEGMEDPAVLLGRALHELSAVRQTLDAWDGAFQKQAEHEAGAENRARGAHPVHSTPADLAAEVPEAEGNFRPPRETEDELRRELQLHWSGEGGRAEVGQALREAIARALYAGDVRAGDPLPSIREIGRETGLNHKVVARDYQAVAAEGLVEIRNRSGVYVSELSRLPSDPLSDREEWLGHVLAGAWEQGIAVPALPGLLARAAGEQPLRCVCVEDVEDDRVALSTELRDRFGLAVVPASPTDVARSDGFADANLVVTTPFHAGQVRRSSPPDLPVLVIRRHPHLREAMERRILRDGACSIVCADAAFPDRLRMLLDPEQAGQVQVTCANGKRNTHIGEPAMATCAALERMPTRVPRPAPCDLPFLDAKSARALARLLVRLNAQACSKATHPDLREVELEVEVDVEIPA